MRESSRARTFNWNPNWTTLVNLIFISCIYLWTPPFLVMTGLTRTLAVWSFEIDIPVWMSTKIDNSRKLHRSAPYGFAWGAEGRPCLLAAPPPALLRSRFREGNDLRAYACTCVCMCEGCLIRDTTMQCIKEHRQSRHTCPAYGYIPAPRHICNFGLNQLFTSSEPLQASTILHTVIDNILTL